MNAIATMTEHDRLSLERQSRGQKKTLFFFSGFSVAGVITVLFGLVFTPQAQWPAVASVFVLLFLLGSIIAWREYNKIYTDLEYGVKERIEGIVSRKQISQGNSKIQYDAATLQRIALREEEEESGRKITRYGVLDIEIDRATRHWYGVIINKENYNVGIQNYLAVAEGDHVVLEIAPKSKRVLSLIKESNIHQPQFSA